MSARSGPPRLIELVVVPVICLAAIIGMTMPLDPGRLTPPDVVYCLMIGWVIRRPARVPLWMAPVLGLLGDVVLMRPIGLGALGLMLATEAFRARAGLFQSAPFVLEWLASVAGFAALLLGMRLVLGATFADVPTVARLGVAVMATGVAYPLVVLGLTWCLRIRGSGGGR